MVDTVDSINTTGLEIAVIGMAGRFPGAKNIDEFWDNLKNGRDSISFFSNQELEEAGWEPDVFNNPAFVKARGVMEGVENFDAAFFGYTPAEAKIMDPQVRIFHECSWKALEDAGYDPETHKGKIGVYAGASMNLYWQALSILSGAVENVDPFSAFQLIDKDYLTMRVSFKLNLRGPSFTVQTACSTSLVAIHLACQGLLSGECSMALAGGVTVTLPKKGGYKYQEGMVLSPDGHCRAFDSRAQGFVGGDGAGVVVLKLLEDAAADGDYIHAVIKGSAINNDGNQKSGFTAPSIKAQTAVIKAALRMAEVEPESISYIETHGTGTPLGDPIEVESLKRAFDTEKKHFCKIGSVKTNVGHLDSAAGMAGLIKILLALKHRQIPPSLYFKTPNPKIDFANSPFTVNSEINIWENGKYPLRAGVTSLGIGGTNAHVILEEAPEPENLALGRSWKIIVLSGNTRSALDRVTRNFADYLESNPGINLADAAFTLQVGRKALKHRRMVVALDNDETLTLLADFSRIPTYSLVEDKSRIVFLFAGLGSQYVNMGLDLYRTEPIFREEMDRCFAILKLIMGCDIKEALYPALSYPSSRTRGDFEGSPAEMEGLNDPPGSEADINHIEISQVVVFILEYALAKLLIAWGIKPDAMIGYSFGEYAAACLSGVFSLEDALKVIVCRGKLLTEIAGGAMLSVPLPEVELLPLLNHELSIAIDNGSSCVVAGPEVAVTAFEQELKRKKLMCMPVPHSLAMHSEMMEPILDQFREELEKIPLNSPKIPYISNVTGTWITVQEAVTVDYWRDHLKKTVRFADGLEELVKAPNSIFIEIGPGRDLSAMLQRFIEDKPGQKVVNLIRPPQKKISDVYNLLHKTGYLWLYGVNIDWSAFYFREKRLRVPLPSYPFDGKRFWFEGNPFKAAGEGLLAKSLPTKNADMRDWFFIPRWSRASLAYDIDVSQKPTCWLLFVNDSLLGGRLVQRLQEGKHNIITIRCGSTFTALSRYEYTINPCESSDYDRLFKELVKPVKGSVNIAHMWGLTCNDDSNGSGGITLEELDRAQDLWIYSLLRIAQAVGNNSISNDIQLGVITDNMQPVSGEEELFPEKATILGPVKVIPLEYTNIHCRSIDIQNQGTDEQRLAFTIETLLREFYSGFSEHQLVAYRGTYRWIESYEPVRLNLNPGKALPLKEKGIYLVTGGFGGMGFALAENLARRVAARLILLDILDSSAEQRQDQWFTSEARRKDIQLKKQKIKELEEMGAEFQIHNADVSNYEQMKAVILKSEERFGKINGVIHTAGLIDYGGIIQRRTREVTEELLSPKVRGTLVLDKLLENHDLDFMVLFSSIGNIFYKLKFGQVGYNAGHEFLDVFAYKKQKEGTYTVTIDWNDWLEVGMAVRATENISSEKSSPGFDEDILAISPSEGIEVFHHILRNNLCHVIVSPLDIKKAMEFMNRPPEETLVTDSFDSWDEEETSEIEMLVERPQISTPYTAPGNDLQRTIARIWEKFFGIKQVGIHDDFFELGGDSLKAMNVSAMIQKELNIEIPVTEFFNRQTVEGLADYAAAGSEREDNFHIGPAEKKEYYALSSAQRRLFVLQQMGEGNTAYNEPLVVILVGNLIRERFENTFRQLIKRHESFRTTFEIIKGEPVQKIHNPDVIEFAVNYIDLAEVMERPEFSDKKREVVIDRIVKNFISPFDLGKVPLFRVGLIESSEDAGRFVLMIDIHHIITDGASQNIIVNDFMALYKGEELPELRVQYKGFSQWQNGLFQSGIIKEQEDYWMQQFGDELPVLDFPADYPRPAVLSFEGSRFTDAIGKRELTALRKIAAEQDATLYMVMLAIINIFLSKLSGQEDIVCGTLIAGRRYAEFQDIIGMFVNTLALRNYPGTGKTFLEFLKDIREKTLDVYKNQDYQFETLVDKVVKNRDTSRNPLFDVMFILQNLDFSELEIPGLKLEQYPYDVVTSMFDIRLDCIEQTEGMLIWMWYRTKLFKYETIKRFISYLKNIILGVVENPYIEIGSIAIMSEEEKRQILYDFNDTDAPYPNDKVIHQLFEEQVEKTPDKAAFVGQNVEQTTAEPITGVSSEVSALGSIHAVGRHVLTYRELNERANQLARKLREEGIQPRRIVGLMVGRSPEMIIGLFGILKAGGAYLPIGPEYPVGRVKYMLKHSGAEIILTTTDNPPGHPCRSIDLRSPGNYKGDTVNLIPTSRLTDPTYVIYTSGTTGTPKGVMIENKSLVNFIKGITDIIPFKEEDTILSLTTIAFDIFGLETILPLAKGSRVVAGSGEEQLDAAAAASLMEKEKITIFQVTPSRLQILIDQPVGALSLKSLKFLLVGGEAFPQPLLEEVRTLTAGRIYNMYGPTETTIWSTVKEVTGQESLNIGKPIANTHVYIVGKSGHPQPVSIPGELCIAGHGLARGYLNNLEYTAEKFAVINDQLLMIDNQALLYRTGDLACWLPDGNIEFLGRIDYQVKVRGYRIELGEIESELLNHDKIKETVVTAKADKNGDKYLCAYIVSEMELTTMELRGFLSLKLPDYMIPSDFVLVEKIPLTPNGKVDRKSLDSLGEKIESGVEYVAPKSDKEIIIADIWKDILQVDEVGIHDNFFDLGGTSVDVIRVNNQLREVFEKDILIVTLYRYTTIASFSHFLEDGEVEDGSSVRDRTDTLERGKADRLKRRELRQRRRT